MNAIKAIYTLLKLLPPFDFSNPPFALAIQGDDSLILLRPEYEQYVSDEAIIAISAELGFCVRVVKITKDVVGLDYCSRYFWPTSSHPLGYVLGPKPFKVLCKIGFSKTEVENPKQHARGVALGLYRDVQHVPLLREWCARVLEITSHVVSEEISNKYAIHSTVGCEPTPLTSDHLYQRYGLTELDVSNFVEQLKQATDLPYFVSTDIDFESCLKVDLQ
jgi:hypothetical protein